MAGTADELIDVHAHFVTDSYVASARAAGHAHPDGMPGWPSWSTEEHLRLMDEHHIRTSLLSISSPGTHFGDDAAARALTRQVNEHAAELVRAHPGRFGHFASLPLPDVDGSLAELAYALDELGSDGVTIETNAHGRYPGDPHFEPLWAELDRRGTAVFVHPTSPVHPETVAVGRPRPMLEFIFDSTRAVSDLVLSGVVNRFPGVRWIFTHGGGTLPLLIDRIELFRTAFPSGHQDGGRSVREQVSELWFDIAGTPFPRQVPALEEAFGSRRILYGSDCCWTPADAVARQIASIDAAIQPGPATWRSLTSANARRLFPRLDRLG
ncbi:amidohydrolase family protein [Streptomyces montanisoli]|uniref:6-methylsalicylate decarboxylase n=1 Tax=Streptomyces montanisoli TaxID=2798581 RepID=A0A940RUG9_9ACTN|nr:amidohydrolase family protein [Streptomyces montanisoli]MBP0457195.1 amidohydrolase [Streptomyces montanisoli]